MSRNDTWVPDARFGKLTIIEYSHTGKHWRRYFTCKCDCGNIVTVLGSGLSSGNTKSCGCVRVEKSEAKRLSDNYSEITAIILGYKRHANSRGFTWDLDRDFVTTLIKKNCFYCGIAPSNIKKSKTGKYSLLYSGIDRVDSAKGYSIDNVVPCCAMCNIAKKDFGADVFLDWIKRIYEHQWG